MAEAITDRRASSHWQQADQARVQLGGFLRTGPLAWGLSRLGGALTGGGRVRAIEALGLIPGLLKFYAAFVAYVNSLSYLRRADSELVIMRTAWNCGAYYEWYQHVYVSGLARLSGDDLLRIAEGPQAAGWTEPQRALLTAVDELTSARLITDETWARLQEHFAERQIVDVCLLAGNYAMLAMLLNSVGAEPEPNVWQRWPVRRLRSAADADPALFAAAARGSVAGSTAAAPAVPPDTNGAAAERDIVARLSTSPHFRSAAPARSPGSSLRDVGPLTFVLSRAGGLFTRGGRVFAADAIGGDPRMMRHYLPFAVKLVLGSHLSRKDTELATLRITWNSGVRYEWYYHAYFSRVSGLTAETVQRVAVGPSADGWTERERALLTAVDELYEDRFISDDTWSRLREHYSERKLASLCVLVGHYDMLAMLFKSYGVEPEPGALQSGPFAFLRRPEANR